MKRWLWSWLLFCALFSTQTLADTAALRPGEAVPDCALVNQEGKPCRVGDFKGRALAVTFLFTRCPLPDYCPRLSTRFLEAQRALAREKAQPWHFLMLSFDPQHDTPAVLNAYARIQGMDLRTCTFATAAEQKTILNWGSHFGLTVGFKAGLIEHNLRTVVIDATGHLQHIFEGGQWTADDLVWEVKKAAR